VTEYKICNACSGYCCMLSEGLGTPVTTLDIERIAKYFGIPVEKFRNEFIKLSKGRISYEDTPDAVGQIRGQICCPFLRQGRCGINSVKPKACKEYVPTPLDNGRISCADWHKARLGWMR
jgi:Fe-S-cluster containining protein